MDGHERFECLGALGETGEHASLQPTVFEHQHEHGSQWAAVVSFAAKIGCMPETLRSRVRRAEVEEDPRAGVSSSELERENRERRRANEILKSA